MTLLLLVKLVCGTLLLAWMAWMMFRTAHYQFVVVNETDADEPDAVFPTDFARTTARLYSAKVPSQAERVAALNPNSGNYWTCRNSIEAQRIIDDAKRENAREQPCLMAWDGNE